MKVVDISGMDPKREKYGYEWGCQVVAARALRWMREHRDKEFPVHEEYEHIHGVSLPHNDSAERMERYILDHPDLERYGVTGAMMQYSIHHAKFRFANGDEAYFAEFKDDPERIFEFDESDAFPEDKKGVAQ